MEPVRRPRLYEEAIRRQEGLIAADGPLVCRTGQHTGRSPNDKFIVREPSSEAHIALGQGEPADGAGAVRRAAPRHARVRCEGKELFVQDCYAGADPAYRLPIRVDHRVRLAQPVRPQPVHRRSRRGGRGRTRREFTVIDAPSFKADPDAARHATPRWSSRSTSRSSWCSSAARATPARSRSRSSRVLNYLLPLQGVLLDALLGEHRRGRRRGAVLRPVGHRQDDAVERSRAAADRRRRARLERSRRLQLRGRLLREDDPAVGRGRAADLRDDAPVRHGARERGVRPGHARARSRRRPLHREHARARIRSRSSTTRCRPARAAIRRTSSC